MKRSWRNLTYYHGIIVEGLSKTTKGLKLAGLWAAVLTRDLPNKKQEY
jgi:hypothetical protein